jgi:hypothetical protein
MALRYVSRAALEVAVVACACALALARARCCLGMPGPGRSRRRCRLGPAVSPPDGAAVTFMLPAAGRPVAGRGRPAPRGPGPHHAVGSWGRPAIPQLAADANAGDRPGCPRPGYWQARRRRPSLMPYRRPRWQDPAARRARGPQGPRLRQRLRADTRREALCRGDRPGTAEADRKGDYGRHQARVTSPKPQRWQLLLRHGCEPAPFRGGRVPFG